MKLWGQRVHHCFRLGPPALEGSSVTGYSTTGARSSRTREGKDVSERTRGPDERNSLGSVDVSTVTEPRWLTQSPHGCAAWSSSESPAAVTTAGTLSRFLSVALQVTSPFF
ncbi:hypothetical protein SKAU_G00250420 [Synaphobranchus kaupii]|uniref:Uncharacterized protein n=1 Tax=Synaphobranchus kaupii TaxID=118154 RepID=A0A9Q1IRU6_SYNKA|nr:hypothetical protein SKAU_G00250420 [Synaphobranchus kaupii]